MDQSGVNLSMRKMLTSVTLRAVGVKRWQMNDAEERIRILEAQLSIAKKVIDNYIDYFENLKKDGRELRQAKTRIEELGAVQIKSPEGILSHGDS